MLIEQQAALGANYMTIVTNADLTAASNTQTLSGALSQTAQTMGLRVVFAVVVTPFTFSDAAITSCAIVVGDANSTNRYLTSSEVSAPGGTVAGQGFAGALTEAANYFASAAITADVVVTGTGGHNLSTCTAGQVIIFWQVTQTGLIH